MVNSELNETQSIFVLGWRPNLSAIYVAITVFPVPAPPLYNNLVSIGGNSAILPEQIKLKKYNYKPYSYGCAENGSCFGDISSYTGRAKTVYVKGYYRKDGTYVRSHYRSKK